jgi:T5SS/PEP-CTERM-associated repeat protein/autotransporter-associated beta strand protein
MRIPTGRQQNEGAFAFARSRIFASLLACAFFLPAPFQARSATETWNPGGAGGGNGTWNTVTGDWDSAQTWTNGNDALFSGSGGTVIVVDPIANSLTFSATGPYLLESGTLTLTGSDVTVNSDATIASAIYSTAGLLKMGAATLTLTGSSNFGSATLDDELGTLAIQGGGGVSGSNGYIANNAGSSGTVTVSGSGSTWTPGYELLVGGSGSGTLEISNGGAVSTAEVDMGGNAGSSGTVTVTGSGSTLTTSGGIYVGDDGTGTLQIQGGAVVSAGYTVITAYGGAGMVTVSGSGSTLANSSELYVGGEGAGTLRITSGGTVTDVYAYIGYYTGAAGAVTVSGSGSTLATSSELYVGDGGNGTLAINSGGTVSSAYGYLGEEGCSGVVTVSGSGSNWAAGYELYIGDGGMGTLQIQNGGAVSDEYAYLADYEGGAGLVTVSGSGSSWTNIDGLYVGGYIYGAVGPGILQITGGASVSAPMTTIWSTGTLAFGKNGVLNGSLAVAGGTLTLVDGELQTITLTNPVTIGAGSNLDFDVGNGSDKLAFSGAGSMLVTGDATINLTGLSGLVTTGTDVLIAAGVSALSLGDVYNSGNFHYALLSTATSEDVVVTAAATPLTTAYWKGGQDNIWSILVGGTATNWTTNQAGTIDPHLTPSATTDVIFSANTQANEGDTVLGTDMTVHSLTISDTSSVLISGSGPLGTNTLTISGSSGTTGFTIASGAAQVTLGANLYLTGSSQKVLVENAAGLVVSGSVGGAFSLYIGGNASGPVGASSLTIAPGGSVSAALTTVWDTGTLGFGGNATFNSPLVVDGGTLTLAGGQSQTVTLTEPVTIDAGSTLDFDIETGLAQIAFSGAGSLDVTGAAKVNLYAISGLVNSGTDVLIGAATGGHLSLGDLYNSGNFTYALLSTATSEDVVIKAAATPLATAYWKGGQDNIWSILVGGTATNWTTNLAGTIDPHLTPSATTDVIFSADSPANETDTVLGTDMTINSLTVNSAGALAISGANPLGTNSLAIAETTGSTGITVNSGAGAVSIGANLVLSGTMPAVTVNNAAGMLVSGSLEGTNGFTKYGTGVLTLTGTGVFGGLSTVDEEAGTLAIANGGSLTSQDGDIGENAGSGGLVTVSGSGSTWTSNYDFAVGFNGNGTLQVTNGGTMSDDNGFIGGNPGSSGLVTVTGSASTWYNDGLIEVGVAGAGTLRITGGGSVSDESGYIGTLGGSTGTVTVSGSASTWENSFDVYVSDGGSATLEITGGGSVLDETGYIGDGDGEGSGTVTVSGSGSAWTNSDALYVGDGSTGTLQINGGGFVSDGSGYLGAFLGAGGIATVTGSGSAWENSQGLYVGDGGAGTLLITGGGTLSSETGCIGYDAGSTGMVTVSGAGSAWTNTGDIYVGGSTYGSAGTGLLRITGGGAVSAEQVTVWDTGTLALGENPVLNSPVDVDGGTLTLVDGQLQTVTLTSPVTMGAGSNLDFEVGAGSDQLALSGSASLSVTGGAFINVFGLSGLVTSGTDVLIAAAPGNLSLGDVYNSGNFTYSLLTTATSVDVVVTAAATPLTTAYWKGGLDDIWSILVGGSATNWTTNLAGTIDPHLTPGATTDVIFSAETPANEGGTVLGTNMTIHSLTISDPNAVAISGANILGTNTLTISGTSGITGITIDSGAGGVTLGANVYVSGTSQAVSVENPDGLLVDGSMTGSYALYVGGNAAGPVGASYLGINGTMSAARTTIWDTGVLAFGQNGILNSPLTVDGGTLTLVDGPLQIVTFTNPVTIDAGSTLDFWVGDSPDRIAFSGGGSLTVNGASKINLYGISGLVSSGTDVLIGAATSGHLSIEDLFNSGNFNYSLLSTATSEDVVVTAAAAPLTTAYWKGGQDNYWSILVGGTATNWSTNLAGTIDPHLTPSATTDVIFSADTPANQGNTELGSDMTIDSLTVNSTNPVAISGSNPFGTNTLTISGPATSTAITVNSGAGLVTIGANLYLSGSSQTIAVDNTAGLLMSGIVSGINGLTKSGPGTLTLTGSGAFGGETVDTEGGGLTIQGGGSETDEYGEIGNGAGSTGTVTVTGTGSTWTNTYELIVGGFGTGTLSITGGGAVSADYDFNPGSYIGGNAGSRGLVKVSGIGSTWTNSSVYVGNSGIGTLQIQTGGVVTDQDAYIGENAGSNGTVTVSGGGSTWTNSTGLYIGESGTGSLVISGGGSVSAYDGYIGGGGDTSEGAIPGTGMLTVTGSGSTWTSGGELSIGVSGTGTLLITGGAVVTDEDGLIGDIGASSGTVTVSGSPSAWTNTYGLTVGSSVAGTLQITGGGVVSDEYGYLGFDPGSSGTITVSGSGSTWTTSSEIYVGYIGTGTLLITGGGAVSDEEGYLGNLAGSSGMVTVSGSGLASTWTNGYELEIGNAGTGTLLIDGGGSVTVGSYGYATIGAAAGASGSVTVTGSGSAFTVTNGTLNIGDGGNGTLQIAAAGAVSDEYGYLGVSGGSGTVTVTGSGSTWTNALVYIGDSGTGTLQISNGGVVSDSGAYIAYNTDTTGMVTLSGSGSTWTNTGYVSVGGNGYDATGSGFLRIAGGASLSAIQTTVWNTSTLALGENVTLNSALVVNGGTLTLVDGQLQTVTLTNATTIAAGSALDFDVGAGSDKIAFSGSGGMIVTGLSTINLYGLSGLVTSGTDILIAEAPGNLSLGNVYNSGNFTYALLSTATSEDVVVTAATPLTTAYWKGGQDNIWSILVGGTATNWTTNLAGTLDPHLTPGATTNVIFSANSPASEGDTVLGTNMSIHSLTISDTDAVVISGSDPNPWLGTNTLTISGTGIAINAGAGRVTFGANVYLSGSSQDVTVDNAAGLIVSGSMGGSSLLYIGGNSTGPAGTSVLGIVGGGALAAGKTTVWNTGTLAIGQNALLDSPLIVDGGTITLVDRQLQTVTLTNPVTVDLGSTLDFQVGNAPDGIAFSGGGSLDVTGAAKINLYGLSGLVTTGTDVLIGAATGGHFSLGNVYNSGNFTYTLVSTATSEEAVVTAAATPLTTAYWKGGQDNIWSILVGGTATNWTTNQAGTIDPHLTPGAATDVIFSANSPLNETNTVLGTDMTVNSLTISATNAVAISGSNANPLVGTNTLTIAETTGSTGITVDSGAGAVSIGANLDLASNQPSVTVDNAAGLLISGSLGGNGLTKLGAGTLTLTGAGQFGEAATVDTESGKLLIQSGGGVSDGLGRIGYSGSSSGMATVTGIGSTWTNYNNLTTGYFGNGTLLISSGGSVNDLQTNGGSDLIGYEQGSIGLVTVTGSGSTWTDQQGIYIGAYGTGTLQISGGAAVSTGEYDFAGVYAGSSGTVTVTGPGSTLTTSSYGDLYIGYSGAATLEISGGGTVIDEDGGIGVDVGSNGMATVTGSGSTWFNSYGLTVGQSGTGSLLISAGGLVSDIYYGAGFIGEYANSTGTVTVTGSGSAWASGGSLYVGTSGTGTLRIEAGGAVSSGYCYLGEYAGSAGRITVTGTGSALTNSDGIYVGGAGSPGGFGLLSITAGGSVIAPQVTVWNTGTLALGPNAVLDAQLSVDGGIVTLVDGQLETVTLTNAAAIEAGSLIDFEVGHGSDQIAFAGGGSLDVTGSATVNLYGLSGLVTSGTDVLIGAAPGDLSLGNVYNSGNFTYSLLSTATSVDVVVSAATPLTTAYWKGAQGNVWSVVVGGSATNWTTNLAGTIDPRVTPGATADVIFSADSPASESDTVLGDNMTIHSLTISDKNAVGISGYNPLGTNTLTISGSSGTTGIAIENGAGLVTLGANVALSGSTQNVTVENAAGLEVSGSLGGDFGLYAGGNSTGPVTAGLVSIAGGGLINAARTIIWDTGTLAFGGNAILHSPLTIDGGTLTLADGQLLTVTFTSPVTIDAGSNIDLEVDGGPAQIALSGGGSLAVTGAAKLNLYGLTGLVASGTEELIAAATGSHLAIGNLYNSGNFNYALLSTATSEDVVVTAVAPLTTAYWKGGQDNLWSILVGGTTTNWTTDAGGTTDPHLTPSGSTDVIFSATGAANESDTVLGANMTINSLTINDPHAVGISGSNANPLAGTNTLTITETTGTTGITINSGAGAVTIGADLYLNGYDAQTVTVGNAGGLLISGSLGSSEGLTKRGAGLLTLTGTAAIADAVDVELGTLAIQGGGEVSSGYGSIGEEAGSSGAIKVTGSGSTWTSSSGFTFGEGGNGILQISGGGAVSGGECYIGGYNGSTGTVTVSGGGSTFAAIYELYVGESGTGTLQISGGGAVSDEDGYIGGYAGSTGVATVTGSGSTWSNSSQLAIGNSGTGTLVISNGGAVSFSYGFIGAYAGSSGMVTVSGGGSSLTSTGYLYIGGSDYETGGHGLLRIASGGLASAYSTTVYDTGTLAFGENATLNSSLSVTGGTVTLADGVVQTVTLTNPATIGAASSLDFDLGAGSDQLAFSGAGSLAMSGTAAVTLYGLSGQVTTGADVLISATTSADLSLGGDLALGNVYNGGNFKYALLSTATSEEVIVTAATPLTTAYWKGGQDNLWSILVGGTATNWTTNAAGTIDPQLTPSATTDVIFTASSPSNDGDTALGTDMTIKSLTVSDANPVGISGSDPNPWMGTDTLTISGSTGTTGITVDLGAGQVIIGANVYLAGTSQTMTVNNAAGLLISGSLGSGNGLIKAGGGVLTLTGNDAFGSGTVDAEHGTLAIQQGGTVSGGIGYIGENAGSNGSVTVTGAGSKWTSTGKLLVGYSGTGTLTITGGGYVSDSADYIGYNSGSKGTVTLSGAGSEWAATGALDIGNLGTGALIVEDGGFLDVTGAMTIGSGGTFETDGHSPIRASGVAVNGGTVVTLGSLTTAVSATFGAGGAKLNSDGFNSTLSGDFSGTGGFAKSGGGTVTLEGASTYTGATAVNVGTLALTTASSQTASLGNTAITVASGATLSANLAPASVSKTVNAGTTGAGTAGATLTLNPGSTFSMAGPSLATFNLQQENSFTGPAFTIGGASGIAPVLIFDIGNAATGTDLLHVTGTVSVLHTGGDITIDALAGDTTLTTGTYDLITSAGGFSGTGGNGLVLSGTTLAISGMTYDLSLANSTSGDEVLTVSDAPAPPIEQSRAEPISPAPAADRGAPLIATASVPEPGVTASLLSAFALAAASRVRRRN